MGKTARNDCALEMPERMENMNTDEIVRALRRRGLSNGAALGTHDGLCDIAADQIESMSAQLHKANERFIAHARADIPYLLARLEAAEAKIKSIHGVLDSADRQRSQSKNYTELAVNNGLALGKIAVILQHDFETLPEAPEEGKPK